MGELEHVRLHRRVLDRIAGALRAAPENVATQRTLEAIERGRSLADCAKAKLVESNLRLVVMFAKRRTNRGLSIHDLIQEGNLGLMKAADKFDHRRKIRFSTYAAWWVKQQMTRAVLNQGRTIRTPLNVTESVRRLERARSLFEQEQGREPTDEELLARSGLSPERMRLLGDLPLEPVSLQATVGEGGDATLGDLTPDRTVPAPDEAIAREHLRDRTRELLDLLTPRERDILCRRFGLDGMPEDTLESIGQSLSLSRERVRQIETEALRKLRRPSESRDLGTYLAA